MKKTLPYLLLFILALMIWNGITDHGGMHVVFDDGDFGEFDGPLGAIFGTVIGTLVMVFVAAVLAVVFAGVGVVLLATLFLGAVVAAIAISPLLLPILIPCAIVWFLARRSAHRRDPKQSAA